MPAGTSEMELQRAMALFEQATGRLQHSYARLQEEVRELQGKLEDSRAERDRLAGYLEHLLESVPSGVVAVDPEGRITMLNRAAQEITGLGASTLGALFRGVFRFTVGPSESAPELEDLEGRPRPVVAIERPGGETAILGLRVSPFRGAGGEILGRVVVFQDVTRLRHLEEQEARNRRLVSMGEMAASIAHEIRNPLGSLELFASHLADELRGGSHEELAAHVLKGIQNLSRITGNLLLFARRIQPSLERLDLAGVLGEALVYAQSAISGKAVRLEKDLVPVPICGDRDLLRQAFLNLLLNAIQAVGQWGRIRVACGADRAETPPAAVCRFCDDGAGVPAEAVERVFDPFYTTRAGGMGLGLAIVQRIVSAHGGWVRVGRSDLGGAEFALGLPVGVSGETY
jgi:PAS domain S-box-containing protein